jgi:hypothetical protein
MDVYIPAEDGSFISERHARISELIQEYDPNLMVRWIPPNRREDGDLAFCVVERTKDGKEVIFCYCDDLDETVLARVYNADNWKNDVQTTLENNNKAARDYQRKFALDQREDVMDQVKTIIKSPLHVFKHNGVRYE